MAKGPRVLESSVLRTNDLSLLPWSFRGSRKQDGSSPSAFLFYLLFNIKYFYLNLLSSISSIYIVIRVISVYFLVPPGNQASF